MKRRDFFIGLKKQNFQIGYDNMIFVLFSIGLFSGWPRPLGQSRSFDGGAVSFERTK